MFTYVILIADDKMQSSERCELCQLLQLQYMKATYLRYIVHCIRIYIYIYIYTHTHICCAFVGLDNKEYF